MKSITIKCPKTGAKLIKVKEGKAGFTVEARRDVREFVCLIVTDENERITIPIKTT